MNELHSKIEGDCHGFNAGAIFKLTNGQIWQQKVYKYRYKYKYRPNVRIFSKNGHYHIEIEDMDETVSVIRVSLVEDGQIVSDFDGYKQDSRFVFENGNVYIPSEYKHNYHYAYNPRAIVIDGINGLELWVDGMTESIRVQRA